MTPQRKVSTQEAAAYLGRALAFEAAVRLARIFESKGADAGTVRVALEFQAQDARAELDRLIVVALDEPPELPGQEAAAVPGGSSNVTEIRKPTCAVCGGPYPDGTGCEFCPRVTVKV